MVNGRWTRAWDVEGIRTNASSASVAATGLKPLGGLGNVSSRELALCSRASPVSRALLLIVLDCALRALLTLSLSLRKGRFY
jgi:hypothetical protein